MSNLHNDPWFAYSLILVSIATFATLGNKVQFTIPSRQSEDILIQSLL